MKHLFFIAACLALMTISVRAQLAFSPEAVISPFPIEITWDKTTVLIFPAEIKSADRGSNDILAQKGKASANVLKLKAGKRNFKESNLHVVTADGNIYAFKVNYDDQPEALSIDIGKQKEMEACKVQLKGVGMDKRELTRFSSTILGKPGFVKKSNTKSKVRLQLSGIYIQDEVLFFRFHLHNSSRIDYSISQWRFTVKDRNQVKRTAVRSEEIEPLHIQYKKVHGISGKNDNVMVVAFEKFTIADAKELVVQLFEKSGDRSPELKIRGRYILKARPVILSTKNH